MRPDQAVRIYQSAIDATATLAEGEDWWSAVRAEMEAVVAAPTAAAAAEVIDWWHRNWAEAHDTPARAARRIRSAARRILPKVRGAS
jgi:hypothetical protein